MEQGLRLFLDGLGALQPADRARAARTTARAWAEDLAEGHFVDLDRILVPMAAGPRTPEVIFVDGLHFAALCPHHLLPVRGIVRLAYQPRERIAPLGQLARLVEAASRRLILQEDLAELVVDVMVRSLDPRGAACVVEGAHDCMRIRGPRSREAVVRVLAVRGEMAGPRGGLWRRELLGGGRSPSVPRGRA